MKNSTTWKKYPIKLSEIIIGNWQRVWNIQPEEGAKVNLILSCIREKSPHIGWAGNGDEIWVNHTGKGVIAKGKSMRQIITALEKSGIIVDDLYLTNKFRFKEND